MSALSDIISRVADSFAIDGTIETANAAKAAADLIMQDAEACEQAVRETAFRQIKERATRLRRAAIDNNPQNSFFHELRCSYAVDLHGNLIKETGSLNRLEFERLISIREKQIADDAAHLDVLRRARDAVSPIWDKFPSYTFGQAERAYIRLSAMAA